MHDIISREILSNKMNALASIAFECVFPSRNRRAMCIVLDAIALGTRTVSASCLILKSRPSLCLAPATAGMQLPKTSSGGQSGGRSFDAWLCRRWWRAIVDMHVTGVLDVDVDIAADFFQPGSARKSGVTVHIHLTVVHFPWESSTTRAAEPLHRVLIDVVGDRLAYAVADLDCARVVHSAPDPSIVTVRACLRDVGVSAVRLTGGRQCKNLLWPEVTEENGRSGAVEAGVPGRIFRVRRGVDERQPGRIGSSIHIARRCPPTGLKLPAAKSHPIGMEP